jgi:elongation factor G
MIPRERVRNIGISAHIDSGKTTLSERILFYTGKIHRMEEVRGGGNGATMDSHPLEKQKGITIASAATTCQWRETQINLIDTPGHVDFTIEVERSLRVLDGAVMVLCAVAGVQSQSITVDRQMKRYRVPRIAFINKMDRAGANPFRVVQAMRDRLNLNAVLLQYPIGAEAEFTGVIDLIEMTALTFAGENGEQVQVSPIPAHLQAEAQQAREKLLDALSLVSEPMTELLLANQPVPSELVWQTIRRATLSLDLTPILLGSAFKNKGVQPLLDAVERYLPSPVDRELVQATAIATGETVGIHADLAQPVVALAFKLTLESFGQLTYTRLYAGTLSTGDVLVNSRTGKRVQIGRMVRMHADKREEVKLAVAGDIIAFLGLDCASGDTFCSPGTELTLESMYVPDPVITLAIVPKLQADGDRISKALNRFCKEDPTFRVSVDPESQETLISGMGELHLEIYLERIKQEYNADVFVGKPAVAYRETITQAAAFDYRLKKQSGGPGQFAHVVGRIEPCDELFAFENRVVGGAIPKQFLVACEKGFRAAVASGKLKGYPVMGVRVILSGGSAHSVDSSEFAFQAAAQEAFAEAFAQAKPQLLEPVMRVEVETPTDYLGRVQGDLSGRRGLLLGTQTQFGGSVIQADVPLAQMFGYSTVLRSMTAGMASFAMEFACYRPAA